MTLDEKGYGSDEVDLKVVDTAKAENFSPAFLRLNPKATVPTLVVPLEKTLSEEVDSRYKALTDAKTIVEFLDKSRSPLSRTHTTSTAPAPALAPATIAFATKSNTIIEQLLYSDHGNPNHLLYYAAVDEPALRILAEKLAPFLQGREQALNQYISEAESNVIRVSEKVKTLWRSKREETERLLNVFSKADKSKDELDTDSRQKRDEYLATACDAWEVGLKIALQSLSNEIMGPYVLGDHLSLSDLHLAGWLSRIFMLVGVEVNEDGKTAAFKLSSRIKSEVSEKVVVFWDTIKERNSWKKVYSFGLF